MEKVCLPKDEGGLGLRRVKEFNEASLMKLARSSITADSLWANWFCARYVKGPAGVPGIPRAVPAFGRVSDASPPYFRGTTGGLLEMVSPLVRGLITG